MQRCQQCDKDFEASSSFCTHCYAMVSVDSYAVTPPIPQPSNYDAAPPKFQPAAATQASRTTGGPKPMDFRGDQFTFRLAAENDYSVNSGGNCCCPIPPWLGPCGLCFCSNMRVEKDGKEPVEVTYPAAHFRVQCLLPALERGLGQV